MKKPILWTIACALAIIATIVGGQAGSTMGSVLIVLAIICAGLQWLVFFKRR